MIQGFGKGVAVDLREGLARSLRCVPIVKFLDHAVHDGDTERRHFGFVGNAEGGGKPQLLKIGADDTPKEGVDRRDLRASKLHELCRETAVCGIGGKSRRQGFGNSAFQLCRRRAGKGDHQETREVGGVFLVGQRADDPLGQNAGLSRACRRRHQKRPSAKRHGGFLRGCP